MAWHHRAATHIAINLSGTTILVGNNAIQVAYGNGTGLECVAPWATDIFKIHIDKGLVIILLVHTVDILNALNSAQRVQQHIYNTDTRHLNTELRCGTTIAFRFVVDATHGEF